MADKALTKIAYYFIDPSAECPRFYHQFGSNVIKIVLTGEETLGDYDKITRIIMEFVKEEGLIL